MKTTRIEILLRIGRWIGIIVIFSWLGYAWSQETPIDPEAGDPFPLENCIIGDTPFEDGQDNPVVLEQGREFRFCCDDCAAKFPEEAFFRIGEIDKLLIEQQRPYYPLEKCIVTGEALGSGAVDHIFRNRLFRLKSGSERIGLEEAPAKYFEKLDRAVVEKQSPGYPLTTCVVSRQPLGDGAIDVVVSNQFVRLAGFEQFGDFRSNPGKYLAVIRAAKK